VVFVLGVCDVCGAEAEDEDVEEHGGGEIGFERTGYDEVIVDGLA
jgi:hypothetical protein